METDRVQILLSTYNGEKYLREQIDSLLNQSHKNIHILVRDDGSKDNTVNILKEYKSNVSSKIDIILGKNIGVIESFFELINKSDNSYDYYFFCDQDDYWEKDKVKRAIELINKENEEKIGYCSNLKLVDKDLKFLKFAYSKKLIPNIFNCFLENIVTGCTYVCNKNLFLKIKEKVRIIDSKKISMHDHYFYFLTCLYGKLIYDENSYILYRQHGNNVIGMGKNNILKRTIKLFKRQNSKRIIFIKEILEKFNKELDPKVKNSLEIFLKSYENTLDRIRVIFLFPFYRQKKIDNF